MTGKRDTDPVPAGDVRALLDLLDGLANRGLASRCTRIEAGGASVTLVAAGATPKDPREAERDRAKLEEDTLFDAS